MLTEREKAAFLIGLLELEEDELIQILSYFVEMSEDEWRSFYNELGCFVESLEKKLDRRLKKKGLGKA